MSATNTTTNLGLSQFINTDVPAWRGDYNGDMLKIDNAYTADISSATAETSADPSDYMKFYDVSASTNKKILVSDLLKGAKVEDLTDTTITSVANEDGLVYNSTSQKWENKQIVQKNQAYNRNLLDNPWFTINQRGEVSYTAGDVYTVDRWKRGPVDASGHSLVLGTSTRGQVTVTQLKGSIFQMIEVKDLELQNKVYTISTVIDGTLCSASFTPVNDGQTHAIYPPTGIDNLVFEITENYNGVHAFGINNSNATSDHAISKMKLELGSFSTLLLDSQPNYEEELLKCQRYYWRGHYAQYATVAEFDSGASWTEIFIGVNAMRATPALTISGSIDYVAVGGETPWVAYSDLRVQENAGGYVLGGNRAVAGSPTAGYCFSTDAGGTTIELSADL